MTSLKDIIAYILAEYPHKDELSNARLTKMVYLSDWKNAIENGRTSSGINWYYDNYGPFVWDVKNEIESHPDIFKAGFTSNMFGNEKTLFSIKNKGYSPDLDDKTQKSIDHVIEQTAPLNWNDFIKLIYSTHPIATSPRYNFLDLKMKAKEYNTKHND